MILARVERCRARTERHGLREDAVLDVLIDRAARKSRACFDLLASKKCRLPLDSRGEVKNPPQRPSLATEFLLQPPDDVGDEIVKTPADAVGHLLHFREPVAEL